MTPLIRCASLTNLGDVAAQCHLDVRALLHEAGLPARCLDEPDLRVPVANVVHLLELAAARAHEPTFGLRMAESRRLSNLGALGLLLREEPTLRDALEATVRYVHVQNEALAFEVEQVGKLVMIRIGLLAAQGRCQRQAIELCIGVTFRLLSIFMGADWHPRLVCFSHGAPAKLDVHRRVFGEAVEFGHEFSGIVCNAAELDARNPGADPVMALYAQRLLEREPQHARRWSLRVQQLALTLLPRGHCRVEVVAQHLGVDRRTVCRRLTEEGTSFSQIVEDLRSELLAHYRADDTRPLGEVAALLGFSTPTNFSRWHRARFGYAARSARRSRREEVLAHE
ncbi:MAG TPA: AraC family transcriptional regulator ligand-binding domain-containing protein [Ramlibacter sp.]|nr:AraC family transcriptional regulator ligand-binding domain-containing protein [Ramlibacter sp.]